MTVENANSRNDYVSNGSAVDYAFTFKILTSADIQVIVADLDGVEDILALTTDYSVTLDSDTGLGEITLNTAVTSGYTISLLRNLDFEQNTAIQNQGTSQFSGYSFERALDKLTLMALQLRENLARSILLPKSSQLTELEIPVNAANAGKAIVVNASGDNLDVKNLADISAAAFSDLGLELVASETAAAMRTLMSAQESADNLTALAGLTGASGKVPYFTGEGEMALSDLKGVNAIINGDFDIWQRGTSFTAVADQAYTADRWLYGKSGTMVHTITRSTDVPTVAEAGRKFNYSLKIQCTTADSSMAAADYCNIQQRIEGYNFLPLAEKEFTASFWIKSSKTGTYGVSVKNSGSDRTFVSEVSINAADTWEYKTVNIPASPSAGTWDYTTGIGVVFQIALAAGTTYQTTAEEDWQAGDYAATSNQVNACDSTSNVLYLCVVKLEAGSVATSFEQKSIQEKLKLCQEYFEKSHDQSVALGSAGSNGLISGRAVGTVIDQMVPFKVTKRTAPSITLYNGNSGASGTVRNESAGTDISGVAEIVGQSSFAMRIAAGVSNAQRVTFHFSASSEL